MYQILGSIEASSHQSDWNHEDRKFWLLFRMIVNLRIEGGGTINGNGKMWWENSCKTNKLLVSTLNIHSCTYISPTSFLWQCKIDLKFPCVVNLQPCKTAPTVRWQSALTYINTFRKNLYLVCPLSFKFLVNFKDLLVKKRSENFPLY